MIRASLVNLAVLGLLVSCDQPGARAADTGQTVELRKPLAIPDATLQPGSYRFSVEDRLADRAIIRIASPDSGAHFLVLAVPNRTLRPSGPTQIVTFQSQNGDEETLRAFACAECKTTFEVVYPKPQAAKILADSGQTVVAFDSSYDKLPQNLSTDDMKVVTLWLASPKRVTPEHRGEGVDLAKLAQARPVVSPAQSESASATVAAKPARGSTMAANRLPKTASNDFQFAFGGLLLIGVSAGLFRMKRSPQPVR